MSSSRYLPVAGFNTFPSLRTSVLISSLSSNKRWKEGQRGEGRGREGSEGEGGFIMQV